MALAKKLREIEYHIRPTGYERTDEDDGFIEAYVTDEINERGMRTLLVAAGDFFKRWYLFDDEWKYV